MAPRVPTRWTFQPYMIVTRNDDGTFRIRMDWDDSFQYSYDADDEEITDVRQTGPKLVEAFLNDRFGGHQFELDAAYLPDGWEEPETPEEKQRREMLVELQEISAALTKSTSNCHTQEA